MTDYPTLSKDIDASSFSQESENLAVATETDGGYVITRSKFTRRPRRVFMFKHTDISEAERNTLQDFWDARKGGVGAFDWTHPVTLVVYNVRFSPEMKLKFSRSGYGTNHRWDSSDIELREV